MKKIPDIMFFLQFKSLSSTHSPFYSFYPSILPSTTTLIIIIKVIIIIILTLCEVRFGGWLADEEEEEEEEEKIIGKRRRGRGGRSKKKKKERKMNTQTYTHDKKNLKKITLKKWYNNIFKSISRNYILQIFHCLFSSTYI